MPETPFTVFVVDDDESILRALKRLLKSHGYCVRTFESAEEMLETPSLLGEGCLVLDIRLPGMTGLDLQEKLSSSGLKFPVVFMTAHDNPQWQEKAKALGAAGYLRKPFGEQSLLDAIQAACRERA